MRAHSIPVHILLNIIHHLQVVYFFGLLLLDRELDFDVLEIDFVRLFIFIYILFFITPFFLFLFNFNFAMINFISELLTVALLCTLSLN